jgi:hypothetical protein
MNIVAGCAVVVGVVVALFAIPVISNRLFDRELAKLLVPSADDPRWVLDDNGGAACGPFRISRLGFVWIGDDQTDASAEAGRRRYHRIARSQGVEPFTEGTLAMQRRRRQAETALAWHRQNEPRALPPDSDELPERPFR